MIDYSKWDNLELSDDSDVEVHHDVDKPAFIRAKQNEIHAQREQRKHQIRAIEYERTINEKLSQRLSSLISSIKTDTASELPSGGPCDAAFRAAMQLVPSIEDDRPPLPPEGVVVDVPDTTYSSMLFRILDVVKRSLGERRIDRDLRGAALLEELGVHLKSLQKAQEDLAGRLNKLQAENTARITSESYRTGFNSTHLNKAAAQASQKPSTSLELQNPSHGMHGASKSSSSRTLPRDKDDMVASPAALVFGDIPSSNYAASYAYLLSHPEILKECEVEGLLMEAYNTAMQNEDSPKPAQYVHQAFLLRYCSALGREGPNVLFKRMATPGHQAGKVFRKNVAEKLKDLREMAVRHREDRSKGLQHIEMRCVDPGAQLTVHIPAVGSPERVVFDQFAPEMKAALASGSLEEMNAVLRAMKASEARKLIDVLGQTSILNIDEDVFDATTDEGRKAFKELQRQAAAEY